MNAITGDVARSPEYEGSGAQSFMLLHILDLADRTRRGGGFGWVQASVWAIEEPESFLHAGLRAQFSSDVANYAAEERRQVFVTTHQDEFMRVSDEVWTARKNSNGTLLARATARDAIAEATQREITTFRHPLFTSTDLPMVVVEGKFDAVHLRAALKALDLRPRWRLVAPQAAFGQEVSGDSIYGFLNFNRAVIASRPESSPVIVLRDWETADVSKYMKALQVHPYSSAI
ncbi:AAA family ATPase, partial [Nocardioides sp.]|uniref:AAA family ATPase n=1 Tax=Nocardioides sp. TaxID=35761 RepID=UPI0025ED713B